jgi:type IV fimbrial biogenesis protein FimT
MAKHRYVKMLDQGWTLVGLLTALVVSAILSGLAVPSFRALGWDSRRTAAVNHLVRGLHLARAEAAKRARPVTLCPRGPDGQCLGRTGNWPWGWMVFVNLDDDMPPVRDPGEPVLHVAHPPDSVALSSNRTAFTLRPFGLRGVNGSISFCDPVHGLPGRTLVVSYTGRPRVSHNMAGSGTLACE